MYHLKLDNFGQPNTTIELYRAILLNEFRVTIFNIIKQNQPNMQDIDIYKFITNWLLFQYIFEQPDDPIIPTNFSNVMIQNSKT